jgi:hypothetical protein
MAGAGWAQGEHQRPPNVLFVGGIGKQRRHVAEVETSLRVDLPHLRVTLGWRTRWAETANHLNARYQEAHALGVMAFTPIRVARRVRATAGRAGLPWIACTGHGQALELAIREAVAVARAIRRPAESGRG